MRFFFLLLLSCHLQAAAPYGQFSSLKTQLPSAFGPTFVKMENSDAISDLELSPHRDRILIKEEGVYYIIAAGQVGAVKAGAAGFIDLWFFKNGQMVPNSGTRASIEDSNFTASVTSQIILPLKAGDSIAVSYTASGPSLGFIFTQPERGSTITSFIMTIFKVSP